LQSGVNTRVAPGPHESTDGRIPSRSRNFLRRVKHPVQTRCKTFYRANVKFARKEDGRPPTVLAAASACSRKMDLSRHPNVTRKPIGTDRHTGLNRCGTGETCPRVALYRLQHIW